MVDVDKWRFWQFFNQAGDLEWIGVMRPTAHARIDRQKIWTLLPGQRRLIANWFISQDHQLEESERRWVHDSIDGWDFLDAAIIIPEPPKDDVERLSRPEAVLTFDQITDIPLLKITGKRDYDRIIRERGN
ncbi:hypothetical protein L5G32_09350 [Gordonia sp. HY002]|uniref:hypothetical protein n=1 Tax=Gordonia zhenghanii TaxID=2911516 RepID=UPI001EEF7C86|nr:hypothetical protein [Gordonia zhenghanii]MCF8570471.1 hypothetical protein [Gordonia zhenghanii]MCF8602572.1 hypothetical protein [Gordonia zhenghanii]